MNIKLSAPMTKHNPNTWWVVVWYGSRSGCNIKRKPKGFVVGGMSCNTTLHHSTSQHSTAHITLHHTSHITSHHITSAHKLLALVCLGGIEQSREEGEREREREEWPMAELFQNQRNCQLKSTVASRAINISHNPTTHSTHHITSHHITSHYTSQHSTSQHHTSQH